MKSPSLLHRPLVPLLDEPTVGLDPSARETVWERVLELRDRFRRTMILTSHHMDEVEAFGDRIALIDRGRIVAIGTAAELKAGVGSDATLDDVFIRLVSGARETESEAGYGEVRRARRRTTMADRPITQILGDYATQTFAVAAAEVQKL